MIVNQINAEYGGGKKRDDPARALTDVKLCKQQQQTHGAAEYKGRGIAEQDILQTLCGEKCVALSAQHNEQ